jgi:hypothetical protein
MYKLFFVIALFLSVAAPAQTPCSRAEYRQFDFWIGEWEAFGAKDVKAGDSKISIILDSCIILEEWTSAATTQGIRYAGKSFNTYNALTGQWQQTWVDNVGGSTEYLKGTFKETHIVFTSLPFNVSKDSTATRRLTFYNQGPERVRQHGEITRDNGISWITEYDLEYRRKKK